MTDRQDKQFVRAEAILEGRCNGLGEPILWHLALRRYGPAMLSLACRATQTGSRTALGRVRDAFSPAGMMYRAFRQGELNAAQNMALSLFYLGDLSGYRRWMHRAARSGDTDAAFELKLFEVRQPYPLARQLRRLRPYRRRER
ncbi:MAG TPA: hypothetical protein VI168_04210 [Croceibacterium sp.]